jgi:hypothetical protein
MVEQSKKQGHPDNIASATDVTSAVQAKRDELSRKSLDEKLNEEERSAFYDHSSERAMAIILGAIVENHLTEFFDY